MRINRAPHPGGKQNWSEPTTTQKCRMVAGFGTSHVVVTTALNH